MCTVIFQHKVTGWLRVAFEGKNFLSLVFFFTDIVRKMILTLLTCHVHEFRGKVCILCRLKIFCDELREDALWNKETATPNYLF